MSADLKAPPLQKTSRKITFAWLWLTDMCQLECVHCYAGSGPDGTHGTMTLDDWRRVIDQCKARGVQEVEFIGGEVTLHPYLGELIQYARSAEMNVLVYSNLVHVAPELWPLFKECGVMLLTSYYTDDRQQHKQITGGHDTLRQTKANIKRAKDLGITVIPGGVDILEGQRTAQAQQQLLQIGIREPLRFDKLREVGRGSCGGRSEADLKQLCGQCTNGRVVIRPGGEVSLCVFSDKLPGVNVHELPLGDILDGEEFAAENARLNEEFTTRNNGKGACHPQTPDCWPACAPSAGDTCRPTKRFFEAAEADVSNS